MTANPAHRWLAAAAIVVVALAILGWRSLGGPETRPVGAGAIPNPQLAQLMPYSKPLSDTIGVHEEAAGDVELRRDPFVKASLPRIAEEETAAEPVPDTTPEKPAEPWNVSATLTAGVRRAAIINDELIYVGDSLPGGVRLTSVERDRVVLTDSNGIAHTVPVKEGEGGD